MQELRDEAQSKIKGEAQATTIHKVKQEVTQLNREDAQEWDLTQEDGNTEEGIRLNFSVSENQEQTSALKTHRNIKQTRDHKE